MRKKYGSIVLILCALVLMSPGGSVVWGESSGAGTRSDLSKHLSTMPPAEQIVYLRRLSPAEVGGAEIHFYLGNAFYANEEVDSAVAEYMKAVEADSAYTKAYVNMGIALDTNSQFFKARWAYEQALRIDPEDVLALCHLGFNYFNRGDTEKAVAYYRKALAIDPGSAQAHYNLGIAFANAKIFKEALVEWRRVVELDPDGALGKLAAENVELLKTYIDLDN